MVSNLTFVHWKLRMMAFKTAYNNTKDGSVKYPVSTADEISEDSRDYERLTFFNLFAVIDENNM